MKKISPAIRSSARKIMIGLILFVVAGGWSAWPAFGEDYRRPPNRYEYRGHGRDVYYYHRRVYRPYYAHPPVYAPPPVYYEPPPPPPGISIFLPPIIIR